FVQGDLGGSFHPAPGPVRNEFHEIDVVLLDGRDATVVLTEVVAEMDPMHYAIRVADQRFHGLRGAERARHLQTIERKRLKWLARAVLIRTRSALGGFLLLVGAVPERITLVLCRVEEVLERLDYRQRLQRRPLLGLLARHPFLRA